MKFLRTIILFGLFVCGIKHDCCLTIDATCKKFLPLFLGGRCCYFLLVACNFQQAQCYCRTKCTTRLVVQSINRQHRTQIASHYGAIDVPVGRALLQLAAMDWDDSLA